MNDVQRNFSIKLVMFSAGCALVWMNTVGPKLTESSQLRNTLENQRNIIQQGQADIADNQVYVDLLDARVTELQRQICLQLDVEQEIDAHSFLQSFAEDHKLTVSRLEPLRAKPVSQRAEFDKPSITLMSKEFRIECVGDYNDIALFMKAIQAATNLSRVGNFRLIPVNEEAVRVVMRVEMLHMDDVPDGLILDESNSTESTSVHTQSNDPTQDPDQQGDENYEA